MSSLLRILMAVSLASISATLYAQSPSSDPQAAARNPEANGQLPSAVPARPTVTSPAHIPPPGYLQFEQGIEEAADSPGPPTLNKQFSIVQATKISLNHRLMVQAMDQPFAHSSFDQGPSSNDTGDLLLGAQVLLNDVESGHTFKPTVALGYNGRVRSGTSANLDTGSYSQSLLLLASGDVFGVHYDTNAVFNDQPGQDAAGRTINRAQFGQSISISRQLTQPLSLTGELWHFTQPYVSVTRDNAPVDRANAVGLLFALGYSLRPNIVLDAGFDRGLTSTSTAWEGVAGFTYLLPHRLWPGAHH